MSATIIDELMITLGLDGSKAKAGMADVTKSIESGLAGVTKMFTGFGAALAGVFSVGSAFSTWKEQALEFGNVARNLHMGIEDVQAWAGAIGKFGGSAGDFEQSVRGLNVQLARMATLGKSKGGKLLESVGVDPGELGRQRDALQVLEELAAAVEQMTPDESRGFLQALGLDSATIMLLQQGRDGMKDLVRQKKEDAVYTKEDYEAIRQYNIEMGKIKKGFIGIMGIAFRTIMPALTAVAKGFSTVVGYIRKHQTAIKAFFIMIAGLVTGLLIPVFVQFAKTLLANPFTWVILAIAALALVIEDFVVWLDGGDSALERFWAALFGDPETAKKNIEEIKERFSAFVDGVMFFLGVLTSGRAWQRMKDNASTAIQRIKDRWQIFMRDVRDKWERFKRDVKAPFERMGRAIDELKARWDTFVNELQAKWDNATNSIANTWQWIKDVIAEGWQWLNDTIAEILDWILTKAEETWQWIKNKCQEALDWIIKKWNEFKTAALDALNSLFAPINAIASAIRDTIGGAIDWAIEKWNALKSITSGGVTFSQSDMSYLGWGGGGSTTNTTNNNSNSTNYNFDNVTIMTNNPRNLGSRLVGQSNGG